MKQHFTRFLLVATSWLLSASTTQAQSRPASTTTTLSKLLPQLALPATAPALRLPASAPGVGPTKRLVQAHPSGPLTARSGSHSGQARTTITETVTQAGIALVNYQAPSGFFFGLVDRVVDAAGNTYLTGSLQSMTEPPTGPMANADFLVVKYSPSGQKLWERSYNNYDVSLAISSDDRPVAVAVDAAGNVLVTGSTSTFDRRISRAFAGFLTLKYSPTGALLWNQRVQGARVASVLDLAVDAAGNVYVEASSSSDISTFAFQRTTVKYSPAGQQLWSTTRAATDLGDTQQLAVEASGGVCLYGKHTIKKYAGASGQLQWTVHSTSDINDLQVDAAGNVLTTGTAASDYATAKYAGASGQQLWEARYDGLAHAGDVGTALRVDAAGNVVVTGRSDGDNTSQDFATLRYDGTSGQQLWVARYNGAANRADVATTLELDRAGNVYVTGRSISGRGDNDFSTIKYTSAGQQQWQIGYNGPNNSDDVPTSIVLDVTGNLYVGSGNTTVTYAQRSIQEGWTARYTGAGSSAEVAKEVVTDAAGNVYVTGYAYNGRNYDYATVKYGANGQQLWEARYNGPADGEDLPTNVVVDATGNVYVSGTSYSATESDYATIKYSPTGQQLWEARYNGPASGYDLAAKVAVDAAGAVYVTGSSDNGGNGSYDYATLKYSASGQQLWQAHYNGPANSYDLAADLVVDGTGDVYVTGTTYSDAQSDYATLKYAGAGGQQLWEQIYNGPHNGYDEAAKLALVGAQQTSVVVAGTSDGGTSTGFDMATTAYQVSTGQPQWNYRYNSPQSGDDVVADLAVSQNNQVVVVGTSYGSTSADYVTHVLLNGQLQWQARYNGPDNSYDEARAVALDAAGNAYVTGLSYNNDGTNDYATVKYAAQGSGEELWAARYDGTGSYDEAIGLAIDARNNVYVSGYSFSSDTGYDFATLQYSQTTGAGPLALATKIASSGAASAPLATATLIRQPAQALTVYPNPASGPATVSFRPMQEGMAQVLIFNQLGQPVATLYKGQVRQGEHYEFSLNSQKLAAGLYTCSLLVGGQRETVRVLIAP
ncbi:T9SS type A sorting domain-containing protein [Hymenobacter volaticus]|uniref:Secretion system C-terminal sorting domain-containing protein n=1 Tax=Hymenobacter volaticus TaxID=2932254 RepID=A0ABY4GDC6_9BACT|nr:T9SS type A sorting domain-containing protein [Hymenobacter volaticus]UOQ68923.1 hypothetical protein MUN86_24775 [Hymenobacter volaticus]